MAKEGGSGGIGGIISNFFRFLFEGGIDTIKEKVRETERRLVQRLSAALMMLAGIIFVAIGVALVLPQFFKISIGLSLLIIGLILIIIAFVVKSNAK